MGISEEEKKCIMAYRIEKSKVTLQEAKDNATLCHWSLAANRLYYAVFYMTLALLLKKNVTAKSHSGVFGIFSKEYIATGILTTEESMLYRQLFAMRQSGDYDDMFDWEKSDILPLIPKTEAFLSQLETLIHTT